MAEGLLPSIVDFVGGINERKRRARSQDALKNYLNSPDEAIEAFAQIDAPAAINMARQRQADVIGQEETVRKRRMEDLGVASRYLRGLPEGADYGAAIDELSPFFTETLGIPADRVAGFKQAALANPAALLDDEAYEAMVKDRYESKVATPGSHMYRGGKVIGKVPFGMKTVTTRGGDGSARTDTFDPNTGEFGTSRTGPSGAPSAPSATPAFSGELTVDTLLPHVVAQESSDNYKAVNAETGALGRYQVMPNTGKVLAQRLGLAWRPDMMRRDDPASRRYQDAIGRAAIQESVDFGGGDPARTFSHYYGGSDERQWGPKTRKYTSEMLARIGAGGGSAGAGAAPITMPGKPGKTYRAATREEIAAAGYPEGTAAQIDQDGKMVNLKTPSAAAQKGNADKAGKAQALIDQTNNIVGMVTRLSKHPGLEQATGSYRGRVPGLVLGQQADDFINQLEALKSNIGLNKLMEFKASSSQGASGFGNLSNAEGERLERSFGDLKRTNSPQEIQRIFSDILKTSEQILRRQAAGFDKIAQGGGTARRTATGPNGEKLVLSADGTKWERVN